MATKTQQGFVILAAPGVGKTWFVRHHDGWQDADNIFSRNRVHRATWHKKTHTDKEQEDHYKKCDAYTTELRARGYRILSSLFWEYVPDAIVLINESVHRLRVPRRKDLDWDTVSGVVEFLKKHAEKHSVPVYSSLSAATRALTDSLPKQV